MKFLLFHIIQEKNVGLFCWVQKCRGRGKCCTHGYAQIHTGLEFNIYKCGQPVSEFLDLPLHTRVYFM